MVWWCRGGCGIEEDNSLVIIGGYSGGLRYLSQVTRYSQEGEAQTLPDMAQTRFRAGCAKYEAAGGTGAVLIVTGGGSRGQSLSSTEILTEGSLAWQEEQPLPLALQGIAGLTLDNKVFITGGLNRASDTASDSIYQWTEQGWKTVGSLTVARYYHGVSMVSMATLRNICTP